MTFINIIQFTVAYLLTVATKEKYSWPDIFKLVSNVILVINAAVVIMAFPKALKRKKGGYATWSSPDRGNIQR